MKLIKEYLYKFKQQFYSKILGRKYFRKGHCSCCGRCCTKIYVRHSKDVIKTEKEFENLKKGHFFYSYLKVIGKDDMGLIFECSKLDKDTGMCTVHSTRPAICRKYPQEEIFSMGASLAENCGYSFEPIFSFEEILKKVCHK